MISQGLCDITLQTLTDPDPFLNWVLYLCKYEKSVVIHVVMHMRTMRFVIKSYVRTQQIFQK